MTEYSEAETEYYQLAIRVFNRSKENSMSLSQTITSLNITVGIGWVGFAIFFYYSSSNNSNSNWAPIINTIIFLALFCLSCLVKSKYDNYENEKRKIYQIQALMPMKKYQYIVKCFASYLEDIYEELKLIEKYPDYIDKI